MSKFPVWGIMNFNKDMENRNVHLVLGISSAGKSTHIKELTRELPNAKVVLASKLEQEDFQQENLIIHYNAFRAFDNEVENLDRNLLSDDKLQLILQNSSKVWATILVVPKSVALKRAILRTKVEPLFRLSLFKNYPSAKMFDLINEVDYVRLHQDLIQILNEHDIPLTFVYEGDESKYLNESEALAVLGDPSPVDYSKEDVEHVLKVNRFEYQKVELPFGLSTKGQSRNQTADIILEENFQGKSVLDIGCAYGYFCFGAEARGATRILGTELKDQRFRGASLIREIKKSKVEFRKQDIFANHLDEQFDIVLLLNVIHHLPFPIYALHVISQLCKEKLILEYPTVGDKKFGSTFKGDISTDTPVIGVSDVSKAGQTFVFNDEAIRRILLHNNSMFQHIEIKPSPFEHSRRIAYCYK